MQDFAFADGDFLAADQELQRALQDVRHLLALVGVHRHDAAGLEVDLSQHLALARHDLSRQHLGDLFERDLVPSMQSHVGWAHGREDSAFIPDAIILGG